MVTDTKFLDIFGNLILGTQCWQGGLIDAVKETSEGILRALAPTGGLLTGGLAMTIDGTLGTRRLRIPAGATYIGAVDGRLVVFDSETPGCDAVSFDEVSPGHVALRADPVPIEADVTLEGVKGFKLWQVMVGETVEPSAVAVDGDDLVLTIPYPIWTDAAFKRTVTAWKVAPVTSTFEAIASAEAEVAGSDVIVRVSHHFGQVSPSLVAADYRVHVAGLTLRDAAGEPTSATHIRLGTIVPPSIGPDPSIDLGCQVALNTLDPEEVRAQLLRIDVPESDPASLTARWTLLAQARDDGLAAPLNGFEWVLRIFGFAKTPDVTDDTARFVAFQHSSSNRVFRLYGTEGSGANISSGKTVALLLGGDGDLGARVTWKTVGGVAGSVFEVHRNPRNGPTIFRVSPHGGAQADESETGKRSLVQVGDLGLTGANGKVIQRVIPLTAAAPEHHGTADDEKRWLLRYHSSGGTNYRHFGPVDLGDSQNAYGSIGLPLVVGRKLVKVSLRLTCVGLGTKRILAALLKGGSGTSDVELLASPYVIWTGGEDVSKDLIPDAGDVPIEEGNWYAVTLIALNGEYPDAGSGVRSITVHERLFGLD